MSLTLPAGLAERPAVPTWTGSAGTGPAASSRSPGSRQTRPDCKAPPRPLGPRPGKALCPPPPAPRCHPALCPGAPLRHSPPRCYLFAGHWDSGAGPCPPGGAAPPGRPLPGRPGQGPRPGSALLSRPDLPGRGGLTSFVKNAFKLLKVLDTFQQRGKELTINSLSVFGNHFKLRAGRLCRRGSRGGSWDHSPGRGSCAPTT